MPIAATCNHCGKAYKVSSKFAGKKAKCTDCGNSFPIPAPAAATPPNPYAFENDLMADLGAAARAEVNAPVSPPPPPRVDAAVQSKCPSCKTPMDSAAIVCINCGFNRKTNKSMQVQVVNEKSSAPAKASNGGFKLGFTGPWTAFITINIIICGLGMGLFSFAGIIHPGTSLAYIGWAVGLGLVAALPGVIFMAPVFKGNMGGRAWIFMFLLCGVPTGLALSGWGAFVKRTMTRSAIAGAHLDQHLAEYLKEGPPGKTNGNYLVGKVVIIDMSAQDISDLQFNLPPSLAPTDAKEVGTTVHLSFTQNIVGHYGASGANAYQWEATVRIFDVRTKDLIAEFSVLGSKPPQTNTNGSTESGSKPDREIIDRLTSLPDKPL